MEDINIVIEDLTPTISVYVTDPSVNKNLPGNVVIKGGYNANTNEPDLETPGIEILAGYVWKVVVPGEFHGVNLNTGDILLAQVDNPSVKTGWAFVQGNLDDDQIAYKNAVNIFKENQIIDEKTLLFLDVNGNYTELYYNSNNFILNLYNNTGTLLASHEFQASRIVGEGVDIGFKSRRYKDLYLSGFAKIQGGINQGATTVAEVPVNGEITVENILGTFYNMDTPCTLLSYNIISTIVAGAITTIGIKLGTEPIVNEASKISGDEFQPNKEMYMIIECNGEGHTYRYRGL